MVWRVYASRNVCGAVHRIQSCYRFFARKNGDTISYQVDHTTHVVTTLERSIFYEYTLFLCMYIYFLIDVHVFRWIDSIISNELPRMNDVQCNLHTRATGIHRRRQKYVERSAVAAEESIEING